MTPSEETKEAALGIIEEVEVARKLQYLTLQLITGTSENLEGFVNEKN